MSSSLAAGAGWRLERPPQAAESKDRQNQYFKFKKIPALKTF